MNNESHTMNINIGDRVLIKQGKINKLTPTSNPHPYGHQDKQEASRGKGR